MSGGEIEALAPNIAGRFYLLRPTDLMSPEPLCSLHELRTVYSLDDLADMHEAMDLREHLAAKAAAKSASDRAKGGRRGRS